ncbi:MAG: hypothetical protein N2578_02925 [Bdellovibrionaceae bacterium]|nr:hypothetical protein [Pseudobdellovibrionaceae bacterium]
MTATIANNAVTGTKIADGSITDSKISPGASISWSKISKSGAQASDVGAVANTSGVPSIQAGSFASRPTAGVTGRLYLATDRLTIYRDTGATWTVVGGGISECPIGFTLIGPPGVPGTFCIHTNEQSASQFHSAVTACSTANYSGFGRAHLCTYEEWRTACDNSSTFGVSGMTGNDEWVSALYSPNNAYIAGLSNCSSLDYAGVGNNSLPYRCCIR